MFLVAIGGEETQIETSFAAAISTAKQQKSVSLAKRAEAPIMRESSLDVTIRSDALVRAVTGFPAFELINVLCNQVTLDPVTGDER